MVTSGAQVQIAMTLSWNVEEVARLVESLGANASRYLPLGFAIGGPSRGLSILLLLLLYLPVLLLLFVAQLGSSEHLMLFDLPLDQVNSRLGDSSLHTGHILLVDCSVSGYLRLEHLS
jgi:hypothetical protein